MGTMEFERVWLLGRSRVIGVCGALGDFGGLMGLFREFWGFDGAGLAEVGVVEAGGVASAGEEAEGGSK